MRSALRLTLTIGIATTLSLSSIGSNSHAADDANIAKENAVKTDKNKTSAETPTAGNATNSKGETAKTGTEHSASKEAAASSAAASKNEAAIPPVAPAVKKESPWESVNERMSRFERRIIEAVAAGRLGSADAKHLRDELDRVGEMEAVFRALPVTTAQWHTTALNYEIDQLTDALEKDMHDRDVAPADLTFLKDDVLRRIDLGARQGRLTTGEVTALKQEFNRISALEHLLTRMHGRLSIAEKLALAIDLDYLNSSARRQMSERETKPFDVAAATSVVEKRAEEALKEGNISADVATAIKAQLAEVRETDKKEGEKGKEDRKNIIALGLWIEGISNRLDEQVQITRKLQVGIEQRAQAVDEKIAQGLLDARLTPLEALELKDDLDLVRSQFGKLKPAAGALKADEEFAFNLSLARLEGLIDRQAHAPSLVWSGAIPYHAHLDTRIKEAVAATRLSAEDAKALDSASDSIAAKMRAAGGPAHIAKTEVALDIAIALQQLSASIDKNMKDRSMAHPNIDALQGAIDKRLGDALVGGQLNLDEGKSAVDELAQVIALRDKFKNSDGAINGRELWSVAFELQRTAAEVEELIHDHPALFPGVEVRRAQIDELLSEGLSSGRLTETEAEPFRVMLSQNELMEKELHSKSPGYSSQQAIELVGGLERAHTRLERMLREKQVPSSDLLAEESRVERKLARFFSLGYLTPLEAETLRRQFGSVVTSLKAMRAAQGGLSYGERLAFLYGFERIATAAERNARLAPLPLPNVATRYDDVEQKIANALALGRLPVQEALDLKGLVEELQKSSTRAQNTGGGMSYPEALVAVIDIERLSKRVDDRIKAVPNPFPDIDSRQAQIDKRIQQAKAEGKLNAAQVLALKAELDRVAEGEVAFRMSDESLNFVEAINLVQDLERLNKRLDQMLQTPKAGVPPTKNGDANKSARTTPKAKKNL